MDERFAYGKFDDEILYQRLRVKIQEEINLIKEKMEGTDDEISKLQSKLIIPRKVRVCEDFGGVKKTPHQI